MLNIQVGQEPPTQAAHPQAARLQLAMRSNLANNTSNLAVLCTISIPGDDSLLPPLSGLYRRSPAFAAQLTIHVTTVHLFSRRVKTRHAGLAFHQWADVTSIPREEAMRGILDITLSKTAFI